MSNSKAKRLRLEEEKAHINHRTIAVISALISIEQGRLSASGLRGHSSSNRATGWSVCGNDDNHTTDEYKYVFTVP